MNITTIILAGALALSSANSNAVANGLAYSESEYLSSLNQINNYNYNDADFDEHFELASSKLFNYFDRHEGIAARTDLDELYQLIRYDIPDQEYRIRGNTLELNFDMVDTGGGGGPTLPIINNRFTRRSYSANNSTIAYKPNLDGKTFIGIDLSKDAAIGIYNFLAEIINNSADLANIISLTRQYYLHFDIFVQEITAAFTTLLSTFIALIPAGLIGNIIKIALIALVTGVALFFASAFFAGMFGYGYYIGFLRHGFLNWEFIVGLNQ